MNWDQTPDYVKRPLGPRKVKDGKFDGFGCCIYCKERGVKLTEEHIVPESLGSHAAIRDGSCERCMKETHAFEGRAVHGAFVHQRLNLGLKKSAPQEIPYVRVMDGVETKEELHPKNTPLWGYFPVILPPRILSDMPPALLEQIAAYVVRYRPPLDDGFRATGAVHTSSFTRMLAKIAYCYAIASLGMDAFNSDMIIDYILGKLDYGFDFLVGCDLEQPPFSGVTGNVSEHYLELGIMNVRGSETLMCKITLFTGLSPPVYLVYLGRVGRP